MLTPAVVKVVHIIHVVDGAVGVEIGRDKLALPVGFAGRGEKRFRSYHIPRLLCEAGKIVLFPFLQCL